MSAGDAPGEAGPEDSPSRLIPPAPAPATRPGNGEGNGEEDSSGFYGPWSLDDLRARQVLPPPAPAADEPPPPNEKVERWVRVTVDAAILTVCVVFVFLQLGPGNLLSDTTPAGGDMGAHVWGPAYLRDVLLPNFQVSGWTPDWYAGFPAYQYYMVLPPLLIVALDLGIEGPLVVLPLLAAAAAAGMAVLTWPERRTQPDPRPEGMPVPLMAGGLPVRLATWVWRHRRSRYLWLAVAVLALLCAGLPYGIAFKLVTIIGPLGLPASAYVFGRLAGLRFPTPALLAAFTLPFLFYRGYSIYGGNIPSTLAGEFSFAISLCLALIYLGVVFRGLDTGKHRAWAAGLLALCGLCHVIPVLWALGATAVVFCLRPRRSDAPTASCLALLVPGALLTAIGGLGWSGASSGSIVGLVLLGVGVAGVGMLLGGLWLVSESARWLTPVLIVAGMLAAFWVGPFYLRRTFMNDMGWEKVPYFEQGETWWQYLVPSQPSEEDLRWLFVLALVGLVLSIAMRVRAGIFLGAVAVANGLVFWLLPQGRLWNARVLPFYYLAVILLAGLALAELVRLIAATVQLGRPPRAWVGGLAAAGGLAIVLVFVGLPLGALPLDEAIGSEENPSGYRWPSFSPWRVESSPASFVNSWADWNYTGYEGKDSYREYHDVVQTMDRLGQDNGCGRAHWEYEQELDRYGTPMALMLLPYWTDGCIGSMEGLYFESSASTPYHFLMQAELSAAPSNPQRNLPYGTFDINQGVQHLQLMGVRYYMAFSDQAVQAANNHPDLSQVASSGPWVVYEVAGSELVTPLEYEPAVLEGVDDAQGGWLEEPINSQGQYYGPSVSWFLDSAQWDVALARGGPGEWQRVDVGVVPEAREIDDPAEVTNIREGDQSISFDVDQVGSPVLVKASYFPNWQADGAEGPWRVAPNLMVVVPTERHVELNFGRTNVEYMSYGTTLLGIVGLVLLGRRGVYRFKERGDTP